MNREPLTDSCRFARRAFAAIALSSLLTTSSCFTIELWSEPPPKLHAWKVVGAGVNEVGRLELRIQFTDSSERTYSYSLHGDAESWLVQNDQVGALSPPPVTIPESNLFDRSLGSRFDPGQVLEISTSSDFVDIKSSNPPVFESVTVPRAATKLGSSDLTYRLLFTVPMLTLDVVTAPIQAAFFVLMHFQL